MARHAAPETPAQIELDELHAQIMAVACRTYAVQSRKHAEEATAHMEHTAATYHVESASAATTLANAWEWVAVSLADIRRGRVAA